MNDVEITDVKESSGVRRRMVQINLPKEKLIFGTPCFLVEPKSSCCTI